MPQLYHQLRAADLAAGQVDNAGAQNLQQMVAQAVRDTEYAGKSAARACRGWKEVKRTENEQLRKQYFILI